MADFIPKNDLIIYKLKKKNPASCLCTCGKYIRNHSDLNESGNQRETFCYQAFTSDRPYIITHVVHLTSHHYATVGSPALSRALSQSQCL